MTTQEFKRQIKEAGLDARKQRGLEVYAIIGPQGTRLCMVGYAELYQLSHINALLARKTNR